MFKIASLSSAIICMMIGTATAEDISVEDQNTRNAIRASLLGNSEEVQRLAVERSLYEQQFEENDSVPVLSDNISILGLVTEKRPPRLKEAKKMMPTKKRDRESNTVLEAIRSHQPDDVYSIAKSNRRYEQRRRVFNTVTNGIFSVLQLQIYGILQPPADLAEYLIIRRKTLSPEERRELDTARKLAETYDSVPISLEKKIASWTEKQKKTLIIQAKENADREVEREQVDSALWWYRQEMLLRGLFEPFRDGHHKLLQEQETLKNNQERSLGIGRGEDLLLEQESELYGTFLRNSFLSHQEKEMTKAYEDLRFGVPDSLILDQFQLMLSVSAEENDQLDQSDRFLSAIENGPRSYWSDRWELYEMRPDMSPSLLFEDASQTVRNDHWDYLLYAENPKIQKRHLNSEEAIGNSIGWLRQLRTFVVYDVLSRSIALPLLAKGTFQRDSWLDAVALAPDDYIFTEEGKRYQKNVLKALNREKRYEAATELATQLDKGSKAEKYEIKWAKEELSRLSLFTTAQRLESLEDLLQREWNPKAYNLIEAQLDREIVLQDTIARIDRRTLKRFPILWRETGLIVPPELLDGKKKNKETTNEGIFLLRGDRIAYQLESDKSWATLNVPEGSVLKALRRLYPRQRAEALDFTLDQPRDRRNIPLAIEGNAFPGIGVAPNLVPLDANPYVRRLYE